VQHKREDIDYCSRDLKISEEQMCIEKEGLSKGVSKSILETMNAMLNSKDNEMKERN